MFWIFLKVVGLILAAAIALFILTAVLNVLWTVYKVFFMVTPRPKVAASPVDKRQVRDAKYEVIN